MHAASSVLKPGLDYFVELDVIVDGDMPVRDAHVIAHHVQEAIRAAMPSVAYVLAHIEPPKV
ncbi:MAG TPA: cation transporter dimerization domain-containing protein [Capsulimonadaceae bacterium]